MSLENKDHNEDATPTTKADVVREVKKPPNLFDKTQVIIEQIEKSLDGLLLTYWNGPNGSICPNDVVGFYEILKSISGKRRIYLLIKSSGGDAQSSLRIVHVLRQFADDLIALVPLECGSAGTMMALGADEIRMGPLAYLTAIDTSIRHSLSPVDPENRRVSVSQDELTRVVNLWREQAEAKSGTNPYAALFQHVHPLVVGAVDRSSSLSIKLCKEILSYHLSDEDKAEQISKHLNSDYPSHSYPITLREAERIGLKARAMDATVNDLLVELTGLYSEMGQSAHTDFDAANSHNNDILNILEKREVQVYYQNDKDWHYRKEERRWVALNDKSTWRKIENTNGETRESIFHIR